MFQFHEFFKILHFFQIFANSVETRTSSRPRRWQTYGFKNEEEEIAGERACVDVDEETVPELLADEANGESWEQRYT